MHVFFTWRWGGSSIQAWMPTYVSILRIPQLIWVWRATVEWYWQGNTEELGEKPVPVPFCPPQTPHGLTWREPAVRGRRLTTLAMARPYVCVYRATECCFQSTVCLCCHVCRSLCMIQIHITDHSIRVSAFLTTQCVIWTNTAFMIMVPRVLYLLLISFL
jgi:hypothetical protein